jgi:hypothetical protein
MPCVPMTFCSPAKAGAQRISAAAPSGFVWPPAFAGEQIRPAAEGEAPPLPCNEDPA